MALVNFGQISDISGFELNIDGKTISLYSRKAIFEFTHEMLHRFYLPIQSMPKFSERVFEKGIPARQIA